MAEEGRAPDDAPAAIDGLEAEFVRVTGGVEGEGVGQEHLAQEAKLVVLAVVLFQGRQVIPQAQLGDGEEA